jgi:hypothetical protein
VKNKMDDILGRVFAIILAVLLMFIFPLLDSWERQDDLSYMAAYSAVVEFVDSVRNTGFMTPDMVESLRYTLAATGNTYEIEMEKRHILYFPNGTPTSELIYKYEFTSQIEQDLSEKLAAEGPNGKYGFVKGDYFYVSVKNTNKTQSTVMKQFLYATDMPEFKIGIQYGGLIRTTGNEGLEE